MSPDVNDVFGVVLTTFIFCYFIMSLGANISALANYIVHGYSRNR